MIGQLVRRICDADPIPEMLGEGGPWTRVYGRTTANGAEFVYEGPDGPESAVAVSLDAAGSLTSMRPWWQDPALPALALLHDRHPGAAPIRYRPGKRCTLRKGKLFLKCLADDRGEAINREALLLSQASDSRLLGFGVAKPRGWLPSMNMVVQARVPGMPVIDILWSREGAALAQRLGRANASLAIASVRPSTRFAYADQMTRTGKYARRLAQRLPGVQSISSMLMVRLAEVKPGPANSPIHGAPHAHQWLDGEAGLQLVDFDRFGLGDPEVEVATFVGEADFEESVHAAEAGEAYRAGFEEVRPLEPALLHAYRVHKHVAKALRTLTSIRPDAEERSVEILKAANRLMAERP